MAKISFDEIDDYVSSSNRPSVKFFGLKNHGDSAIVRILHQSKQDLDINVIHNVFVNNRNVRVSCLRKPSDPISDCPLCEAGERVFIRTYVHLLVYRTDEQGNQVVTHEVFDRGRDYIEKIATLAETYPPLYDTVFMIKRNGKSGDTNTTYDFMPLPSQNYNTQNYPYTLDDLSYEPVLGTIVWDKNKEEIQTYLQTGDFPRTSEPKQGNTQIEQNPQQVTNTQVNNPQTNYNTQFNSTDSFPVGPRRRI